MASAKKRSYVDSHGVIYISRTDAGNWQVARAAVPLHEAFAQPVDGSRAVAIPLGSEQSSVGRGRAESELKNRLDFEFDAVTIRAFKFRQGMAWQGMGADRPNKWAIGPTQVAHR